MKDNHRRMDENIPDYELIKKARDGDIHSQGLLVRQWYKRIYNFAYKFFGNHDLAMEVSQQTFIILYRKIGMLKDISKFRSWLYTILANQCREERRRNELRKTEPIDGPNGYFNTSGLFKETLLVAGPVDPEEKMIHHEQEKMLAQALLCLSDEQREVLILKEYEGLKFREIAQALKISENTAKSRLYYAFQHLKRILSKQGIN